MKTAVDQEFERLRRDDEVIGAALGDGSPTIAKLKLAIVSLSALLDARNADLESRDRTIDALNDRIRQRAGVELGTFRFVSSGQGVKPSPFAPEIRPAIFQDASA
jgi:hypothetical protein